MNILVTGGAGFIGSNLLDVLLLKGEKVSIIDDFNDFYSPKLKRANISAHASNPNFTLYELDLCDSRALDAALSNAAPDVICHLGARAGVRPSIEDPLLYEEVNTIGTLNLLEAVRGSNIKLSNFVFASSSSVYGINSKLPFSEVDRIEKPVSPYAATKRAGELMLYTYSLLYDLPVTCLRFFTAYGERGRPEMAIANFTRLINEGSEIPLYGDGSAKRDYTYIGDIVEGIMASVYKPFPYEIINLGESRTIDVTALISLIERALGKKAKINYLPASPGDVPATYADISKARTLLGYEPKVDIDEGIKRYVKWYIDEGIKRDQKFG
jgi:UDP-glucuronate 4-epimerase